jgi:hypothetical protein
MRVQLESPTVFSALQFATIQASVKRSALNWDFECLPFDGVHVPEVFFLASAAAIAAETFVAVPNPDTPSQENSTDPPCPGASPRPLGGNWI